MCAAQGAHTTGALRMQAFLLIESKELVRVIRKRCVILVAAHVGSSFDVTNGHDAS